MPIDNVRRLMRRMPGDEALRERLMGAVDQAGREAVLKEEGLYFTDAEFEEAVSLLHASCQTQAEANWLFEFKAWWEMLRWS